MYEKEPMIPPIASLPVEIAHTCQTNPENYMKFSKNNHITAGGK